MTDMLKPAATVPWKMGCGDQDRGIHTRVFCGHRDERDRRARDMGVSGAAAAQEERLHILKWEIINSCRDSNKKD